MNLNASGAADAFCNESRGVDHADISLGKVTGNQAYAHKCHLLRNPDLKHEVVLDAISSGRPRTRSMRSRRTIVENPFGTRFG